MFDFNHYILFIQNNYTKQTRVLDVSNTSDNKKVFKFDDVEFPEDLPYGEYNYALLWDIYPYTVKLSNSLLDSRITITLEDNSTQTFKLRDLTPDTGILKYVDGAEEADEQSLDDKAEYYSL